MEWYMEVVRCSVTYSAVTNTIWASESTIIYSWKYYKHSSRSPARS